MVRGVWLLTWHGAPSSRSGAPGRRGRQRKRLGLRERPPGRVQSCEELVVARSGLGLVKVRPFWMCMFWSYLFVELLRSSVECLAVQCRTFVVSHDEEANHIFLNAKKRHLDIDIKNHGIV